MAQTYTPLTGASAGGRLWKNAWFECCGDCDDHGWGTCCIGSNLPFLLFGRNRARAFNASGIKWGLYFLLPAIVVGIWYYVYQVASAIALVSCVDDSASDCEDDVLRSRAMLGPGFIVVCILAFVARVALGWYNRYGLRQKFGLPGNHCTDCLLWTCCQSCAVCQEARTLAHGNVENGAWLGPDVMLVAKGTQPSATV